MHATKFPESGPKLKLVEAAEQLFADKGFEAVSVRDITKLAGANVAAVNYHFGSRDGLVAVVLTRYITPVNKERLARLDKVEKTHAGGTVPVEEIVEAFVAPFLTQVRKSDLSEKLFFKLMGRAFGDQCRAIPPEVESQFTTVSSRFIKALSKSLPDHPVEELIWRMHFMAGAMLHMLSHQEMLQRITRGASGSPSMDTLLARFVRFASIGLRDGSADGEGPVKRAPQATFDF